MFGDNNAKTAQETPATASDAKKESPTSRVKTRDNAENDYVFRDWAAI